METVEDFVQKYAIDQEKVKRLEEIDNQIDAQMTEDYIPEAGDQVDDLLGEQLELQSEVYYDAIRGYLKSLKS